LNLLWWRTPQPDPDAVRAVESATRSYERADQRLLGAERFAKRAQGVRAKTQEQRVKNHLDEMFVEAILMDRRRTRERHRHA